MKHSYHLDSLRGFLSLIVVMQHTAAAFIYSNEGLESPVNTYLGLAAHYSVLFFFALSGYVITLSIAENKKRNGAFKISEYVMSRSIRIIPPLVGAFFLSLIFLMVLKQINAMQIVGDYKYFIRKFYSPDVIEQIKAILTLTTYGDLDGGPKNVNGALWSLKYEIQFYVFAGLLAIILTSKKIHARTISTLLIVLYAYKINLSLDINMQWISFVCFASGSVSYLFKEKLTQSMVFLSLLVIVLFYSVGYQTGWTDVIHKLRENIPTSGSWMVYHGILGMVFAVLLAYAHTYGRYISWFHKLSPFSYSLYITHFPIIVFTWFVLGAYAPTILGHSYLLSCITIFLCVAFAWGFAFIFERPKQQRAFFERFLRS